MVGRRSERIHRCGSREMFRGVFVVLLFLLRVIMTPLASVHQFRHTVKVDQQAEKDLVRRGAVFVNASQVAQDGNARDILAVECKHTGRLRAQMTGAVRRGDVAMNVFVMHVICGGDLGEETGDHLDDIRHGHGADLKLPRMGAMTGQVRPMGLMQKLFTGQTLDMREAADADADAARRSSFGPSQGLHGTKSRSQARRIGRRM